MLSMVDDIAFDQVPLSIAMTETLDDQLREHLDKGPDQEDLTFALWRPSWGRTRLTAILQRLILPEPGDRMLHGNVAFTPDYIQRVLQLVDDGCGIALLHSHLGSGWQGMSHDDVVAESDSPEGQMAPGVAASGFGSLQLHTHVAGQQRFVLLGDNCA